MNIKKTIISDSRLVKSASMNQSRLFKTYNTGFNGLSANQVKASIEIYGENILKKEKEETKFMKIIRVLMNPFTIVLLILAFISFFTDVVLANKGEKSFTAVLIIISMVTLSTIVHYIQEEKSNSAAEKLSKMIQVSAHVEREDFKGEIPISELVVGDLVHLSAGDMLPADVRIISATDLFISQSSLTGESEPVEKIGGILPHTSTNPIDYLNLAFMGTNVISGSAKAIIIQVGNDSLFGAMASSLQEKKTSTHFEKGIQSVSWLLIRFMIIMVPFVLFVNGFTKGDWLEAFLFALSIAVGLTPEMLPMIVTTTLAKGAVTMSKQKTIIKNINSIQNFGAMDILCTDKTGTLTQDEIILEYHLDVSGNENERVLRHAFFNSYYQTGLKNLLDQAIIHFYESTSDLSTLKENYRKIDEIPFDFGRRRMSVVIEDNQKKRQMVTKGAVEEMLDICSYVEYQNQVLPLSSGLKSEVLQVVNELNNTGMRVIAVAQKSNPSPVDKFSIQDECDMVLMGYLAFLDPPKESSKDAINALKDYGVTAKVLTGDNELITAYICKQVGIAFEQVILGTEIELMNEKQLAVVVEDCNVFAKLSPQQKARIVNALKDNGHTVGYMGDGINDALAMKASDVGISVDTAVDIAKESADVILLEKDLMVLQRGAVEGRKTYGNIIKYIKMTASSNFGNMFSVLVASIFLPFMPMLPIQILFLNLIYDISCISIPWDNVDDDFLHIPRKWDASSISKFMVFIGPTSSIFDIITFMIMFFIIAPSVAGGSYHSSGTDIVLFTAIFHTGWFVESLWSQTLVIHMLRTEKIPFLQSRSSKQLFIFTSLGILVGTIIPYTPFASGLEMAPLPINFFAYLAVIIVSYMILVTIVKKIYIWLFKEFL